MRKVKVAAELGVPLRTPCGVSVRPVGKVPPSSPKRIVPNPPVAVMVALYGTPTVPFGRLVVVTLSGGATEMPTTCVAVTGGVDESVTCTVKLKVPTALVVPLTMPLLRVRPEGSDPAVIVNVYGVAPPATIS